MPIVAGLEKMHVKGWLATLIAVLIMIVAVIAVIMFVLYTVNSLIAVVPAYSLRVSYLDSYIVNMMSRWRDVSSDDSLLKIFNIDLLATLMPVLRSVSSSAITILKDAIITILLTVFLLIERHTLVQKLSAVTMNSGNPEKVSIMLERLNKQVSKYLVMKFVLSLITGALFYIIGFAVGLDLAFFWAILAVVLNFIPSLGSIIITVATVLMSVIQFFPDWTPVLIVASGTIATQMIIGNILDPRLQGNRLNLSSFIILVSLSIFGYIWGMVGMFLAVPITSIFHIIFANMESTRGIAILMSSGSSIRKRLKANGKSSSSGFDEIVFPQNNGETEKTDVSKEKN